jgi:hypothetical protein
MIDLSLLMGGNFVDGLNPFRGPERVGAMGAAVAMRKVQGSDWPPSGCRWFKPLKSNRLRGGYSTRRDAGDPMLRRCLVPWADGLYAVDLVVGLWTSCVVVTPKAEMLVFGRN